MPNKERKQLTLSKDTWAKITRLAGVEMIKNPEAFAEKRGDATLRYVEMLLTAVVNQQTLCPTCGDAGVEIVI
jgi:DnaJ-class molecular chaperone